jgi:hypothetical protein
MKEPRPVDRKALARRVAEDRIAVIDKPDEHRMPNGQVVHGNRKNLDRATSDRVELFSKLRTPVSIKEPKGRQG